MHAIPALALTLALPALSLVGMPSPEGSMPDGPTLDRPITAPAPVEMIEITHPDGSVDCSFAIRGRNNMSFDVWVELYDSTVRLEALGIPALFRGDKQLKIQNYRIATGKTMDVRYTASGACSTKRSWRFYVRIGGRDARNSVLRTTNGTEWRDRIVDLGDSSKWGL